MGIGREGLCDFGESAHASAIVCACMQVSEWEGARGVGRPVATAGPHRRARLWTGWYNALTAGGVASRESLSPWVVNGQMVKGEATHKRAGWWCGAPGPLHMNECPPFSRSERGGWGTSVGGAATLKKFETRTGPNDHPTPHTLSTHTHTHTQRGLQHTASHAGPEAARSLPPPRVSPASFSSPPPPFSPAKLIDA